MILEARGRKLNGSGDLIRTVSVMDDDGSLIFEDVVNLSRNRQFEAFVVEVADRAKVSKEDARKAVKELMEHERAYLQQNGSDQQESAPRRERKSNQLVQLLLDSGAELFHDQYREAHVAMLAGDRRHIFRLDSLAFRVLLSEMAFSQLGEVVSTEVRRAAISTLEGIAMFRRMMHPLSVRVAWYSGAIYYDLGDWRAVRITPTGWEIEETPPILFRHFPHQKAQVEPVRGGSLFNVHSLLNLSNENQKLLYEVDLVAGLIPGIPRPVSVFYGAHGSAKSWALRIKRELQDPVETLFQGLPRDAREFAISASKNLCFFLDNVSSIPDWLSDALARLCTGDSFDTRALYTNTDSVFFKIQGIGGINGINLVVENADLLDRALLFKLERIPKAQRREESEIIADFEAMKPELLGAMFDALSQAMALHDQVQCDGLPRLADYARWGAAAARALGYEDSEFWGALDENASTQTRQAIDASPIAQAAIAFMQDKTVWEGRPAELLEALNLVGQSLKMDTTARVWPKDASWLTRRLNLVVPNLADEGITFQVRPQKTFNLLALRRGKNASEGPNASDASEVLGGSRSIGSISATPGLAKHNFFADGETHNEADALPRADADDDDDAAALDADDDDDAAALDAIDSRELLRRQMLQAPRPGRPRPRPPRR